MRLPQRLAVTHKDGSVPHWQDNEQILVMVSGMCKLTIDGKIFDAHPGDLLFLSRRLAPFARSAPGLEGCVYYEIFVPARPGPTARLDRTVGPAP
ncbi:MAG: hypothetical protein EOR73_03875 [Mesorhizobium sp.]|nr:MAG: hypothetical protein EOR73_03875 [Mesorhizobium sp.]